MTLTELEVGVLLIHVGVEVLCGYVISGAWHLSTIHLQSLWVVEQISAASLGVLLAPSLFVTYPRPYKIKIVLALR